tara:strand:+ start:2097 stop:3455 length:1359 start_codon:yes stop_codon:yes gene_type:complete
MTPDDKDTILVVDDERAVRETLGEALEAADLRVVLARGGEEALAKLKAEPIRVVLCDLRMPQVDGMAVLHGIRAERSDVAFILMTAFATVETAVAALKAGASDYLMKPLVIDEVIAKVQHLLTFQRLSSENLRLRDELRRLDADLFVGPSASMQAVSRSIAKAAPRRSTVLLVGESGTGKDVVARTLHRQSPLAKAPYVVVDLGAIPESLLESQLFGSVKGAFTGAGTGRKGLFQAADGGTLFLDEIGNLTLEAQAKLLRAIESGEVLPVGGVSPVPARARIVAATNRDLEAAVADGTFRQDLYYRLNVLEIRLPPLRERKDDIPGLVSFLVVKLNTTLHTNYTEIPGEAVLRLVDHTWPGNVRELQNVLERAMVMGDGLTIRPEDLRLGGQEDEEDFNLRRATREFEREHIHRTLVAADWSRKDAAQRLGISTTSLWRRMTDLGIESPDSA